MQSNGCKALAWFNNEPSEKQLACLDKEAEQKTCLEPRTSLPSKSDVTGEVDLVGCHW